ncbi:amidohydrolase family protein, partial [bacterium]|nr:amidohydrolase family protein [bacterium]
MKIFTNFDSIDNLKTVAFTNGNICEINIDPFDFPYAEIIDLNGKFLSCGFIDSHTHFLHSALEKSYIDLNSSQNNEDIIELMKKSTKNIGYGYDSSCWIKEPKKNI